MSEELKPCPFCGGKAVLLGGPQAQECHSVWCLDCSAKMQGGMQSEPLVEKWNARPAPAVQVPEVMTQIEQFGQALCGYARSGDQSQMDKASRLFDGIAEKLYAAAPAPATANEEHF